MSLPKKVLTHKFWGTQNCFPQYMCYPLVTLVFTSLDCRKQNISVIFFNSWRVHVCFRYSFDPAKCYPTFCSSMSKPQESLRTCLNRCCSKASAKWVSTAHVLFKLLIPSAWTECIYGSRKGEWHSEPFTEILLEQYRKYSRI